MYEDPKVLALEQALKQTIEQMNQLKRDHEKSLREKNETIKELTETKLKLLKALEKLKSGKNINLY